MLKKSEITASIEALEPAPAGESLHQVAVRAAHWLLGVIADEHPAIAQAQALYARVVDDGGLRMPPTEAEWQANIDDLDRARDRALDRALARDRALALDLARARALALALALALDLDLARARALDLDLARDLAMAVVRLLGDRLQPIQHLDRTILAAVEAPGCALEMAFYHRCETTHCRAGWAITLHPLGRELEKAFGPWLAGAVIYQVSTGRVPNFFASNIAAMDDMRACAAA